MLRGVSILPIQHLALDKWVTFSNLPQKLNPLYSANGIDLDSHSDKSVVHILLETNIYPDLDAIEMGSNIVTVSTYAKMLIMGFFFLTYKIHSFH